MTIQRPPTDPAGNGEPFSREEVMAGLERILASEQFVDSTQLCRFLRYTVEARLDGNAGQLKESLIGATVFRRGVDFDPKSDPIVRVQARRLRARLESYYGGQGSGEALRIILPKGGYAPVFEIAQAEPLSQLASPAADAPADPDPTLDSNPDLHEPAAPFPNSESPREQKPRRRTAWLLCAAASAAILCGLAYRLAAPADLPAQFWTSILQEGRSTLIVPADTGLAMLQDLVHQAVPLHDYITGEYRTRYERERALTGGVAWTFGERRYTPMADLDFVASLTRRPEAVRARATTRFARDVRVEDIKGTNLILLGPKHMNPWLELFEKDLTFRLEHNEVSSSYHLVNTKPLAEEVKEAVISSSDVRDEVYGIVSFHRSREGASVLILSGTGVAGTEAAADFVLDNAKLLPILQKAEKSGRIRSFDLLLHGRNLAGAAPRAAVVGIHIVD